MSPFPGLFPSDPPPPVATPNWAKTGGSGELGCSGKGSVIHGETHFLSIYKNKIGITCHPQSTGKFSILKEFETLHEVF